MLFQRNALGRLPLMAAVFIMTTTAAWAAKPTSKDAKHHAAEANPAVASEKEGAAKEETTTEYKIVFFRHGEKPDNGNGQLTCKGLNRALYLPKVLDEKFGKSGKPGAIYAPNPGVKITDNKQKDTFNYVRPLTTVEPTAIALGGFPVNTEFGYDNISGLKKSLIDAKKPLIYVAWEHVKLNELLKYWPKAKLQPPVPDIPDQIWKDSDYDWIVVLNIDSNGDIHSWEKLNEEIPSKILVDTCFHPQ